MSDLHYVEILKKKKKTGMEVMQLYMQVESAVFCFFFWLAKIY